MKPATFTDKQAQNARLAQALRELSGDFDKLGDLEVARCGKDDEIPIIWPARNIKDVLGRAADLIDELTIKAGTNA